MEKIDSSKLGLLVKSVPFRKYDNNWMHRVITLLIQQRVHHCKSQLDEAMNNDEAFFMNHSDSETIVYKNGGHFAIPVYNEMVDWLDHGVDYNREITQQALRQHLNNLHNKDRNWDTVINLLSEYRKTERDLENVLTEILLVA